MASKRKPHKYWQSLENTIYEVKKVMEEHNYDTLPPQHKLIELGYSGFINAIREYHGGLNNFREKHLGEELLIKPRGYWQNLENTISESKKLMEEHNLDKFPTGNKLIELGYSSLNNAIREYHGGLNNFRKTLKWNSKSNAEHLRDIFSGRHGSLEDYIKRETA